MSGRLPIRMLADRLLVSLDEDSGDRRSTGGIVIPATAALGKRLSWARVEAIGAHVRSVEVGDRVLFDPEDRSEVEVRGEDLVLLRERDLHAVASERIEEGQTGLYL
ncbi:co-chaperone GroES [Aeromicrobium sp. SMF47]|uniref:Co-chaperone GroES n=1 Tax=Aeromicrobium yanjiei TaxID=2662028 RepID=A0A5Q2MCA6_9ACTN|nr:MULTISPECIES: co-chaperone GroES [Aeromicrobium]MRJ78200.1 co-chaperone GroES [Aeromicrobium yanjiei]MRK03169.1 co-chaperone GroES [Aeromicrobium sp. S22]QGG40734.1 co-chaperone GroES [Aeromicrobium yanjiei]